MKRAILILSILALIVSACKQGTTEKQIEADLVESYKSILDRFELENWEGLDVENKAFKEKLLDYASNYPATLTYEFDSLKKVFYIASSDDGLFRIYSWDTRQGGTMCDFENVFQFKSGNKVYAQAAEVGESIINPFCSEIFTLNANGKTYYLAVNNHILSSKDLCQSIKAFTVENSSLNETVELFKTETELLNEINICFDFFSVADRPERPFRLIKYDPDEKIVYVPVVLNSGKVTDRFTLYQFDGEYFQYILTQKSENTVEGTYRSTEDPSCSISLNIQKSGDEYTFVLSVNETEYNGKVSVSETGIVLEGIPWVCYHGTLKDGIVPEGEGEPTYGIDFLWEDGNLTMQNYGNAMNYFVKLSCGNKYITLERE